MYVYGYDIEIKVQLSRFVTIEVVKEISKQELSEIPKSAFQKCFKNWQKRWHKVYYI